MKKFPKPFFRPVRQLWYVQLDGRQINLGGDKDDAYARYHQLMLQRGQTPPSQCSTTSLGNDSVIGLIEIFLDWCAKNKATRTYEWYVEKTSSFARSISRTLSVNQLKPFHVQNWIDAHPKWAPGMKRACMTAVQRVFNWAVKQGRITSNPIRHLEKPPGGRREIRLTQADFDRVLRHVSNADFRDLLLVCWETGCRPEEVVRVESRHVEIDQQRWVFPPEEAKGKRQLRVVYLTPAAVEITKRWTGGVAGRADSERGPGRSIRLAAKYASASSVAIRIFPRP